VDTAQVAAGQRVLIHGAGGGVGHLAVQIAKARGAHVTATASAAKHDLVASLGADELVDYRVTDFAAHVDGMDVVLDTIGGDTARRSIGVLRPGGLLVTIVGRRDAGNWPPIRDLRSRQICEKVGLSIGEKIILRADKRSNGVRPLAIQTSCAGE